MYKYFISKAYLNKSLYQVCLIVPNMGFIKVSKVCKVSGFLELTPISKFTNSELQAFSKVLDSLFFNSFSVGFLYYKFLRNHQLFLNSSRSIKSSRLLNGLPVRGQRTRTNCKTAKKLKFKLLQ